ncbi:carbohydrate ABC transporter permease [Gracilinema caldarium]|uniref:carbohydrate ABC transporter permease n=1 Tax=Gracilinema caldarium TaxID=215591 RepID=UPI0026E9A0D7|nr:carbohydrate ABC transporter permease [Gracilinema caldarium]
MVPGNKNASLYAFNARLLAYLRILLILVLSAVALFPIYAVLVNSFKNNGEIFASPFTLPSVFTASAYVGILTKNADFWIFLTNSCLVALGTISLNLLVSFMAALALSRLHFRGRTVFYNYFIMGMLFPITVAILPLYLQLRALNLIGSLNGVVLSQVAFSIPMSVFILTNFFKEVPQELQEATQVDGGGIWTFGFRVLLPISGPVVSTVTILTFIQSWNQFLLPLLVLDNRKTFTIPLGVMQYQGQFTSGWNFIMAFITISMIPMVLFYLFLQKYIVSGLTAGAIKG